VNLVLYEQKCDSVIELKKTIDGRFAGKCATLRTSPLRCRIAILLRRAG
jgi:hypothetical protein